MTAAMVTSLLYVSRCIVPAVEKPAAIADIVASANRRNPALDVTGALISTANAFAQILEGSAESVEELMVSIRRDPRHTDLQVVVVEACASRRFTRWSLAYSGLSNFVARRIEPLLLTPAGAPPSIPAEQLIKLMVEFVSA